MADKMLIVTGRKLNELKYIDPNGLIAWGAKKKRSDAKHDFAIFGIKERKLMILPFVDLDNILYDKVEYYSKGEVTVTSSKWVPSITITFSATGEVAVYSDRSGDNDMVKIAAAFNRLN